MSADFYMENVLVVWLTGWAEWREYDEDNKRDYYEVLGVSKTADAAAIKKHTGNWRKNTIRIPMQETLWQRRS